MPVTFLSTLSAAARMAYPAIVGGVQRGLSANKIQSILTGAGIGIRRSTLLNVVASARGVLEGGGYLRGLRAGQRFNPYGLRTALTKLTREFAITLKVEGTNLDTGQPQDQYITLAMDKPMERDDMLELARELAEAEEGKRYGMEVQRITFDGGVRASPLGVL